MAVSPGSLMTFAGLQSLAALANGKISYDATTAPTGLKRFVSPLYTDGSGNAWGYRTFSNIAIDPTSPGIGYKAGDLVSAGFSSSFEVVMVSGTGAVLGIRPLNTGTGLYADTATSPISVTAGIGVTGTGLKLTFGSFAQFGPTSPYDFSVNGWGIDFGYRIFGTTTSYFLVDGGTGYIVGDTLNIAALTSLVLTVATVDGGGKILTFTVTTGTTAVEIPQTVASMATTGGTGTGAKFGAYFVLAVKPAWLTELNRLRGNINLASNAFDGSTNKSISGPWPISAPSPNYRYQEFYFPDTGSTVNLTISTVTGVATGQCEVWFPYEIQYNSGVVTYPVYRELNSANKKFTLTLIIGGDAPVTLVGVMSIPCKYMMGGRYDGATSTWGSIVDAPSVTAVAIPFGTFSVEENNSSTAPSYSPPTPGYKNVYVCIAVNQTVAPGEYTFVFTTPEALPDELHYLPGPVVDYYLAHDKLSFATFGSPGSALANFSGSFSHPVGGDVSFSGTFSATRTIASGAVATNGIHGTKNVFKIPLGKDARGVNSLFGYHKYLPDTFSDPGAFTLPTWSPTFTDYGIVMFGWTLSTLPAGLWTGVVPMVSSLQVVTAALMPWNQQRTKYGSTTSVTMNPALLGDLAPDSPAGTARISNGYSQGTAVEFQTELPSWVASRYFSAGFNIIDSNGNIQIVQTAGTSGSGTPLWSTIENITTSDGSVTWKCRRIMASANIWAATTSKVLGEAIQDTNGNTQVVVVAGTTGATMPIWAKMGGVATTDGGVTWEMRPRFVPGPHRQVCVPVYPFYWDSETIPFLKPPTSTSGLTRWGAYNQWRRNVYHSPSYDVGWQEDNKAYGWWIYSISLNRQMIPIYSSATIGIGSGLGIGGSGIGIGGSPNEIDVTIGCIRNGAFVAFGSYRTGATYQVLWPIFTSDALVYQCSERIDLQAVAIANGGAGVSLGATASSWPPCATFISDPQKLLDLIP